MWFNVIMIVLLRSPLHGMLSKNTMLISYQGRKTGKKYTTPVNYVWDGEQLLVTSQRQRTWWRNLLGGAPVTLRLQGKDQPGVGEALTSEQDVTANLLIYLQRAPQASKYFNVGLDANGQPRAEDVSRAAQEKVVIRIRPTPS